MASKKKASANFENLRKAFGLKRYTRTQYKNQVKKLIDLHLVKPGYDLTKAPTKYMQKKILSLKDVLTGNAQVLHIPKKESTYYKESGFKTQGNRHVIVPTPKNTKVKYAEPTPEGMPQFTTHQQGKNGTRTGKRTVVPYTSLQSYLRAQVAEAGPLVKTNDRYAFRYRGASSYATFTNVTGMLAYLEKYEEIEDETMENEFESIEVFKTTLDAHQKTRKIEDMQKEDRATIRRRAWREQFKSHRQREEGMSYEQTKKQDAERKRAKRANETPTERMARLEYSRQYKQKLKKH